MPEKGSLLLASFAAADLASLRPHLKPTHLEQTKVLFEPGDIIEHVYFPTGGIVSLVVGLSTGEWVETAMVGKDGMIGASAALDSQASTLSDCAAQRQCVDLQSKRAEIDGATECNPAFQSHSARTNPPCASAAISRLPSGTQYRSKALPLAASGKGHVGQ
jgi:CRP-like cAMP-binding protein